MSEEITPLTQPRAGAALEGNGGTWRWESSAPIRYPDPDIVVLVDGTNSVGKCLCAIMDIHLRY